MAKSQTEKSRYPSKYSPKAWVTGQQKICEKICEMRAASEGQSLPVKFWTLPKWSRIYREQLKPASTLLKEYSASAVLAALDDPRAKRFFSLRHPSLARIIAEKQREYEERLRAEASAIHVEVAKSIEAPRKPLGQKQSLKSKLD